MMGEGAAVTSSSYSPLDYYYKEFSETTNEYSKEITASDLSSRRLINEKTIAILPSLIETFKKQDDISRGASSKANALRDAIGLQQLHYQIRRQRQNPTSKSKFFHLDKWWFYGSMKKWKERDFPFWSSNTIIRMFQSLESRGVIQKNNFNKRNGDKTLWFS